MRADRSVQPFNTDPDLSVAPDPDTGVRHRRRDSCCARRRTRQGRSAGGNAAIWLALSGAGEIRCITRRDRACVRQNQSRFEVPACSRPRRRNGPSQSGALLENLLEPISRYRRGESRTRAAEYSEATWCERGTAPCRRSAGADCSCSVRVGSRGRTAEQWSDSGRRVFGSGRPASFTSRALRRIAAKRPVRPPSSEPRERIRRDVTPMPVAAGSWRYREESLPRLRFSSACAASR